MLVDLNVLPKDLYLGRTYINYEGTPVRSSSIPNLSCPSSLSENNEDYIYGAAILSVICGYEAQGRDSWRALVSTVMYLTLEGPCIIFFAMYIHSNEIHNVVALVKCSLVLRYQLYMFRTVTVHPQELLIDTVCADYGTW